MNPIKRLRYYSVTYLIGLLISWYGTGFPEWYYWIPVKIVAIFVMLVAGNGIYYIAEEGVHFLIAGCKMIKYILISFAILFIFAFIQHIFRIDLAFIVGI
ncbi:hypothetical protein CDO73_06760 [Saccharibacillus sp. O23]|uniref:hypothetical protein n=1 Tax=Saccharibacillus sp. O23 TaxID=2009338 RepID=UPI000B4E23A1|nr:hypothetical protein [Saccharibacillus sp. O23]OWR31426.1 hypothetical protein CDO73_06760 [Saccharibacillus sp. O23]